MFEVKFSLWGPWSNPYDIRDILCKHFEQNFRVEKNVGTLFFVVVADFFRTLFALDFQNVFKSKGLKAKTFRGHTFMYLAKVAHTESCKMK